MAVQVSALSSPCISMATTSHVTLKSRLVSVSANRLSMRRPVAVRCQIEEQPIAATPPPPPTPTPTPKPAPKVSTKFSDVLAFSGPAPERINGRLAMIGFVAALAVEAAKGDDLFVQLTSGGFPWFVATAVLFSAASLVPLFKGEKVESKSNGFMNANAELWNGRFAMLGLVALAFTEFVTGGPLV